MTRSDILKLIQEVECEPYEFRFDCVICVREEERQKKTGRGYRDRHLEDDFDHVWFVQAKLWRKNEYGDDWGWGYGGKYLLSEHMTKGEVVKKLFVACRDYAEHEVREPFKWRGRRILGPHLSIDALWEVAEDYETRA